MDLRKKGRDLIKENVHLDVFMLQRAFGKEFEGGMSWDGDGSVLGQLGSGYTSLVSFTIANPRTLFQDFGVKLMGETLSSCSLCFEGQLILGDYFGNLCQWAVLEFQIQPDPISSVPMTLRR